MPDDPTPQYKPHDPISSKEKIEERRAVRANRFQESQDPVVAGLQRKIDGLERLVRDQAKELADLKKFREGMSGDENIMVNDNKVTWIGRIPGDGGGAYTTVDFCDDGVWKLVDVDMRNIRLP